MVVTTLQALSFVEKAVHVRFLHTTTMLEGPMEYICECKMDGEVYKDFYVASDGSCFMVACIVFKNRLLEVGLTEKQGDHGTPNARNR